MPVASHGQTPAGTSHQAVRWQQMWEDGRGESWEALLEEKQKKINRNNKCKHYNIKEERRKIHRGKK